jgi:RimJ/RimL family protein N-acetyltransferase
MRPFGSQALDDRQAGILARMQLRDYQDSDFALTRALEIDPIVMRHLGGVPEADRARAVHDKRIAGVAAGDLYWTITPDGADEPAGLVAIWREEFRGEQIFEYGIMMRPASHRQGLGLIASRTIIAAFRDSGQADELHAFSSIGNIATDTAGPILGFRRIEDVDLDYEGSPLRCHHWILPF